MLIQTQAEQLITQWSGGTTTQLFIWPPQATLVNRDFLLRISTATVETESSTFSLFHNYQRVLFILKGSLTLSHHGSNPIKLNPYQQHTFDGGIETTAQGKVTDFNIIFSPELSASAQVHHLTSTTTILADDKNTLHFGYLLSNRARVNNRTIEAGSFIVFSPDTSYTIESQNSIWIIGTINSSTIPLHLPKTNIL